MAPGSVSKVTTPEPYRPSTQDSTSTTTSTARDSDVVETLSPRVQKLIHQFEHLPWFERTFGFKAPIVWFNVYIAIVGHLMALYGVVVHGPQCSWTSWVFFNALTLFSGLGVTAGAHRFWAHKTYKAKLPFQATLMLFNCMSMQNDIIEWCRDHRVHHKYTETDADPHNALRGFFFAHMGWLMMKKHPQVFIKGKHIDVSDLQRDPVVKFQHDYYLRLCFMCSVFLPVLIPTLCWGENPVTAFFVLFVTRYVLTLHSTWMVNSAAHLWGARPYDTHINPSNNRFVSVMAIGEGWHNYHHTFPYDYSTSEFGPSINITTTVIDMMAMLGQVYDRKQVSHQAIDRVRKRLGDLSTASTTMLATS